MNLSVSQLFNRRGSVRTGHATEAVYLGDIEVRRALNALVRDGVEVHLEPKVMDVLALLMRRADEVVTRAELLDEVWDGRTVGEEALTRCISELRSALGDTVRRPNYIQTVPKRGYRLLQAPRIETTRSTRRLSSGLTGTLVGIVGITLVWTLSTLYTPTPPDPAILQQAAEADQQATTPLLSATVAAPDLYFLGRHYWGVRAPESLERAVELFNEAISLDPELAGAYSGLADTYLLQASYSGRDPQEAASLAAPLIQTALELDPESADAYASLGILESHNRNSKPAEGALRRAIELDPTHTMALMWLGNLLQSRGELSASHELYERAYLLDPRQVPIVHNYLQSLMMRGEYATAEKIGDGSPATSSDIKWMLAHLALEQGHWQRVMALAENMEHDPVGADAVGADLLRWRVATAREELSEGERYLRSAASSDPSDTRVYLAALEHRTFLSDASEFTPFLDGLSPAEDSPGKIANLAQAWRVIDRIGHGEYGSVVPELEALLDSEPADYPPYSLQLLGYLLVALNATGDEEGYQSARRRGLAVLTDATRQGWGSFEFHLQSALFLAAAGQIPQAASALREADNIGDLPAGLLALDPRVGELLDAHPVEKLI